MKYPHEVYMPKTRVQRFLSRHEATLLLIGAVIGILVVTSGLLFAMMGGLK